MKQEGKQKLQYVAILCNYQLYLLLMGSSYWLEICLLTLLKYLNTLMKIH